MLQSHKGKDLSRNKNISIGNLASSFTHENPSDMTNICIGHPPSSKYMMGCVVCK